MTQLKTKDVAIQGLSALAAELGCSRFHLGAVLHGRRLPGPELAEKLKARGLRCRPLRPRRERWV